MKKLFIFVMVVILFLFFSTPDFFVYNLNRKKEIYFKTMVEELKNFDVVFVGEYHNHKTAHEFELEIFKSLYKAKNGKIVLSLEMFERDVQRILNDYLSGKIDEKEFLKNSRPWKNYQTDYRPLVEFAKKNKIKVIAGNVPRRYAAMVSREGLTALLKLSQDEKLFVAKNVYYDFPRYRKLFYETMDKMRGGMMRARGKMKEKFYLAQCLKDSTMAESILNALKENKGYLVLHINGCFHSDYKLGTAGVLMKMRKELKISNIKVINPEEINEYKESDIADYLVWK